MTIDLSVIIVNWNTRDLLHVCLKSLYHYTHGMTVEVFVVDNGSNDGSADMVAHQFPQVILLRNQDNVGFPRANNQALRQASGRYLLLLNSDTALKANALQKLVTFMDAHPTAGIAGPKLLNPDDSRQYSCDMFPRTPLTMLRDKLLENFFPTKHPRWSTRMEHLNFHEHFLVDYVIGAVFIIRRTTVEQIGLLDEQFFMYAEDIDWCYRAALAGWKIYYVGQVAVYHYNRGSSEKSPEQSSRLQAMRAKSLRLFYRKHYGRVNAFLLLVIMTLKSKTNHKNL